MDCGNELFPERLETTGDNAYDAADWGSQDLRCSGSQPQTPHNIHTQHTCDQLRQRNICGRDHREDLGFAENRTGENRGLWPQDVGRSSGPAQEGGRWRAAADLSLREDPEQDQKPVFVQFCFRVCNFRPFLPPHKTIRQLYISLICDCVRFNSGMH